MKAVLRCCYMVMRVLTWLCGCWGDRGGERLERLGMLLMEGMAGMVRLGGL